MRQIQEAPLECTLLAMMPFLSLGRGRSERAKIPNRRMVVGTTRQDSNFRKSFSPNHLF